MVDLIERYISSDLVRVDESTATIHFDDPRQDDPVLSLSVERVDMFMGALSPSGNSVLLTSLSGLTASSLLTLKVACVVGRAFSPRMLEQIFPVSTTAASIRNDLTELYSRKILVACDANGLDTDLLRGPSKGGRAKSQAAGYANVRFLKFANPLFLDALYGSLPVAQRAKLHASLADLLTVARSKRLHRDSAAQVPVSLAVPLVGLDTLCLRACSPAEVFRSLQTPHPHPLFSWPFPRVRFPCSPRQENAAAMTHLLYIT